MEPEFCDEEAREGLPPWEPSLSFSAVVSRLLVLERVGTSDLVTGALVLIEGGIQPSGQSLMAMGPSADCKVSSGFGVMGVLWEAMRSMLLC